ncbi:cytochrome c biogenesis protein, partial [Modestobacter roseus]
MIDESLAALSDTLFSVTVGLYSLAVVAFCAELAFGRPARARALVAAGHAPAEPIGTPAGADDAPETGRARRLGLAGMVLTVAGALTHAGVLVTRGMAADRLPWGNMYEFSTAVVLVAVIAYAVLAVRTPSLRHIGVFVLAPVVLSLVLIGLFLYVETGPLVAALRSSWLAVHVSTATLGFGIFFVSGIASILYLVRS